MTIFSVPMNGPGVSAYYHAYDAIWLLAQLVALAVPATLLFTGYSARLRDRCARIARGRRWATLALASTTYLTLVAAATLPFWWWLQVGHPAGDGRPAPATGEWLVGNITQLVATVLAAAALIGIPYALMKRFPRLWWLPTAGLTWLAACTSVLAYQQFVQPRLATEVPFPDGAMKERFVEIAARCGIHDVPVFIAGGSTEGATVVGLGPTSRILISQNIIDDITSRHSEAELIYTYGHEFKHFLFNDNLLAFTAAGFIIVALAAFVATAGNALTRRFGDRFGFTDVADPASVPLLLGIATAAVALVASPALNFIQRDVEREADRFSIEVTHQSAAMASYMNSISSDKTLNEFYPIFYFYRANHPSTAEEVRLANNWHPWRDGVAGKYDQKCAPMSEPRRP